ncbi:hypothetical protein GWO13_09480 [Candidatus Bathyarchaeota archaeon]|nr:hypothetical protein [Candidatus Bathyarchaeota archaeon]
MDLKDLTPSSDTVEVAVLHPATLEPLANEDGSPMTITMFAPHSKKYKAAMHEQTNKRLKKAQSKNGFDFTAEELEEATLDLLAKTTKEWNITFGGEQPKLTVTKAKEIYSEVFWIKDQIEGAVSNSLDFMKA